MNPHHHSLQVDNIRNILVTGGAGFIGSHFIKHLLTTKPEYHVVNLDKLDYCASLLNVGEDLQTLKNYTFVKGDITHPDLVSYIIKEKEIDTIVHFAAQSHVDNSFGSSYDFTHTNVMGTHVLLETSRIFKIKRFIHISTDEVYGEVAPGSVDYGTKLTKDIIIIILQSDLPEKSILAPTNPYAASKAAAEMLVHSYRKSFGLPVIITRSNNVYGPNQYPEKVIPKFICMLLRKMKCCVHGDGQNTRRYIYISDCVNALDLILHKGKVGSIYNIGTLNEISNINLAKTLVRLLKENGDLNGNWNQYIEFSEDRQFNDKRYAIDSNKLSTLGWEPLVDFEEGLKFTIEWYRNNAYIVWGDINYLFTPFPKKGGVVSTPTDLCYSNIDSNYNSPF